MKFLHLMTLIALFCCSFAARNHYLHTSPPQPENGYLTIQLSQSPLNQLMFGQNAQQPNGRLFAIHIPLWIQQFSPKEVDSQKDESNCDKQKQQPSFQSPNSWWLNSQDNNQPGEQTRSQKTDDSLDEGISWGGKLLEKKHPKSAEDLINSLFITEGDYIGSNVIQSVAESTTNSKGLIYDIDVRTSLQ